MNVQVTSVEQSVLLIRMGVPPERASMVWHRMFRDKKTGYTEWALKIGPIQKFLQLEVLQIIPAYTVADIMELLPMFIGRKGTFYLNITPCYEGWYVGYELEKKLKLKSFRGPKLVDVLVAATDWVLSNGYMLNV